MDQVVGGDGQIELPTDPFVAAMLGLWMSVPSMEKCSCDMSALIRGCAITADSRRWATSPSSSLLNGVGPPRL